MSETASPVSQENKPESGSLPQPKKEPLKVLLTWKSPVRLFQKRDREFYTTIGSIIFLVCVALLFFKEFLFILAIIAFTFFIYVINTVPPEVVEHRITNKGIETIGKLYFWDQLGRFWFEKRSGQGVLFVENFLGLPPRLMLLLSDQKPEEIAKLLDEYLIHEKPEKTQVDKAAEWLQRKVPIQTSPHPVSAPKSPTHKT